MKLSEEKKLSGDWGQLHFSSHLPVLSCPVYHLNAWNRLREYSGSGKTKASAPTIFGRSYGFCEQVSSR